MPPSGFTERHSKSISSFFYSCLSDLIDEGGKAGRTPGQALWQEIANIDNDLEKKRRSVVEISTLNLIRAFYLRCAREEPKTWEDLKSAGAVATKEIVCEIEAIKVEELATT